ncbi:MAG: UPF0104 family protein [Calditrichaeota bacterium]|nr:MAG: UPF0104 family protein [Calditrichota bacterium]
MEKLAERQRPYVTSSPFDTAVNASVPVGLPGGRTIRRGIQLFILFSLAGILVSFWWKHPTNILAVFRQINWGFFPLVLALVGVDYLLGGLRFRVFFNGRALPFVSLWHCMQSNWANLFMGAVTPFQTGGGPAQFYFLWRKGARISDILLASAINFTATLLVLLLSCLVAVQFLPPSVHTAQTRLAFETAFGIVGAVLLFFFLLVLFPQYMTRLFQKLVGWLPGKSPRIQGWKARAMTWFQTTGQQFHEAIRFIFRKQVYLLAVALLLTCWLYFNKFLLAYVLARMLQSQVPFWLFLNMQIIQLFIIYFAPTPGASGVAELSAVWLIEPLLSPQTVILFAVGWRFFTTLLAAVLGGIVLFLEVRRS